MKTDKFWQIKNEITNQNAEILLYGDISTSSWWDDEVTPKQFADDLAALNGKPVTVRINSPGGDVFAAHAIYNQLKSYKGGVTVQIDGLAASAASIVMMAGEPVVMPSNAAVMIHNPMFVLWGYYDSPKLEKMAAALGEIKESIINAYLAKSNLTREKLSELMDAETWMSAVTAKEYGFADEIKYLKEGMNNIAVDGNFLVVNSVRHDMHKLKNSGELCKLLTPPTVIKSELKEEKSMEIKTVSDLESSYPELVAQIKSKSGEEAVAADRERLKTLDALSDPDNPAVQAIIAEAKNSGKCAAEIQTVINIIKQHTPAKPQPAVNQGLDYLNKVIGDNKNSGVDAVKTDGNQQADDWQETVNAVNYMTQLLNQKNGRAVDGTGK